MKNINMWAYIKYNMLFRIHIENLKTRCSFAILLYNLYNIFMLWKYVLKYLKDCVSFSPPYCV